MGFILSPAWKTPEAGVKIHNWGAVILKEQMTDEYKRNWPNVGFYMADFMGDKVKLVGDGRIVPIEDVVFYCNNIPHPAAHTSILGPPMVNVASLARACHNANKAICETFGDFTQKKWEEAEQWQRDSAVRGVEYRLQNPEATPEDQHNAWSQDKLKEGWKYGPIKDAEKKEHPCLVPYCELPPEQRVKDSVFGAIVDSMK